MEIESQSGEIQNKDELLEMAEEMIEELQSQQPKKRVSKLQLFGRIPKFEGQQHLTKSTPVTFLLQVDENGNKLGGYYDEKLKDCLIACGKSQEKTEEIFQKVEIDSIFLQDTKIPRVFSSMATLSPELRQKYRDTERFMNIVM